MAELNETSAALRISGDDLDPSEITALLGCEPTLSRRKGDEIPSAVRSRIAKTGQWHLEMPRQMSGDLTLKLGALLDKLTPDLDVWKQIASRFEVDIYCGLFMDHGNEGFELPADLLKALGDRRIDIGFDIYGPTSDDA